MRGKATLGMQLGEVAKAKPAVAIGSYPFFELRARDPQKLALAKHAVEDMLEPVRRAQSNSACGVRHGQLRHPAEVIEPQPECCR